MACPLFLPTLPLAGAPPEAMPLGDFYTGECAAAPGETIDRETLRRGCNVGYARAFCARAAAHSEADAVRFLARAIRGNQVELAWAMERNHHPVAVGTAFWSEETAAAASPLEYQTRAFARACLRQRPSQQ